MAVSHTQPKHRHPAPVPAGPAAATNGAARPSATAEKDDIVPGSTASNLREPFIHALRDTVDELHRAQALNAPMHSAHEGYAVLLEEVDELWHAIKHESRARQREEGVQVAAMALRLLIDVLADAGG